MIEKLGRPIGREALGAARDPGHADRSVEVGRKSQFRDVLTKLGTEIDRGEALVRRAVSGGHSGLDAGELIALQAGIYRYTEAVDLAAKLVDRAGAAVKTTLQGSGGG